MSKKIWEWIRGNAIWDLIKWGWPTMLAIIGTIWATLSAMPPVIIACIAIFLFVMGWVMVKLYFESRKNNRAENVSEVIDRLNTCEFYLDRQKIKEIIIRLQRASSVDAWFNTGSKARDDIFNQLKLKRLMLIDPDAQGSPEKVNIVWTHSWTRKQLLKRDKLFFEQETKDMQHNIKYISREALRRGVGIRWLSVLSADTFMIADSDKEDGWILCSLFAPFIDTDDRPMLIIERKRHEKIFNKLVQIYNATWDNATRTPKEEDCIV